MEVDVVDVRETDEGRARHRRLDQLGAASIRIELRARPDLAAHMVSEICRAVPARQLQVLRIWSAEPPGLRVIQGAGDVPMVTPAAGLHALSRELGVLHVLFARGAHVELRGCGDGLRGSGRLLALALARLWGVPVQAGQVIRTTGEWRIPVIQAAPSGALMLARGARVWSGRRAG